MTKAEDRRPELTTERLIAERDAARHELVNALLRIRVLERRLAGLEEPCDWERAW